MNRQVTQMISPQKDERISKIKLFPTIDFLSEDTLGSWIKLKRLSYDYGNVFLNRQGFFLGSTTLSVTILVFGLIAMVLEIFPIKTLIYTEFIVMLIYDISLITLFICMIAFTAAEVNQLSMKQIDMLWNIKSMITEVINFNEFYFSNIRYTRNGRDARAGVSTRDSARGATWIVDAFDVEQKSNHLVYHPLTHDVVVSHRKRKRRENNMDLTTNKTSLTNVLIRVFKERNNSYEELMADLVKSEDNIADAIEKIEWMDEFQNLEIGGFKVTYLSIGNFIVTVLSIFGALIQNYWLS